jgi:rhodanese-related sulfurtransferase
LLLGVGTAMVYPTLLAAIGDVAHPSWRASSVGIYRFWRDSGYAVGALIAGIVADAFGLTAAVWVVAALTMASGVIVSWRMKETLNLVPVEAERACIKADELSNLLAGKSTLILDVRSNSEFSAGSIPGSINIPVDALHNHMSELGPYGVIVTVCAKGGGRSLRAAKILRENGRPQAFYLCEGYQGWRATRERELVS